MGAPQQTTATNNSMCVCLEWLRCKYGRRFKRGWSRHPWLVSALKVDILPRVHTHRM